MINKLENANTPSIDKGCWKLDKINRNGNERTFHKTEWPDLTLHNLRKCQKLNQVNLHGPKFQQPQIFYFR